MKNLNEIVVNSDDGEKIAKQEAFVRHWMGEIESARKRESKLRSKGKDLCKLYEGDDPAKHQFNILFSNTETLAPAVYNSTPRPVVKRRFKDADPLGAMAAKCGQRVLEYLLDDGMGGATFDDLIKMAVLEALVPGRGVVRYKYESEFEKVQNEQAAETAEDTEKVTDPSEEDEQEGHVAAEGERVSYECVAGQEVPWDRFYHGYAKKWADVPWVAYEWIFTKEELEQNFGEIGATVEVTELESEDAKVNNLSNAQGAKGARVYEIWDKVTKRVIFIAENKKEYPLKLVDDPLNLPGFFDCPEPLSFLKKITSIQPTPLYQMYEEQAKELNLVTVRINKLISMLKVRGFYDATIQGIEKVLESEDGTLIPAENVAGLQANGGGALDKALWLMPIEKVVAVVQQLYANRMQVKTVIYEITGIADIMRGSSQASETLGAQEIKNQWGTLRLKRFQKSVSKFACDGLRMMLEIAVTKFSEDTIKAMTGLPYPTGMEKQQLQAKAQEMAMVGQQPPPELVQQLQTPSFDEVLKLLRNDLSRSYRIDIETNSTVDAEATEDKQSIAELLTAMSQFLSGMTPLITQGAMPFDAAKGMLLAITRRFQFGPELEEYLQMMKQPEPQPDPKAKAEEMKMQGELQKMQMDLQAKQQDMADKKELMQLQLQIKREELQLKREELQLKAQEMHLDMHIAQQKAEIGLQTTHLQGQMKVQQMNAQTQAAQQKAKHSAQPSAKKPVN